MANTFTGRADLLKFIEWLKTEVTLASQQPICVGELEDDDRTSEQLVDQYLDQLRRERPAPTVYPECAECEHNSTQHARDGTCLVCLKRCWRRKD